MSDLAIRLRQVHARVEGLLKDRHRLIERTHSLEEELRELKRGNEVLQARVTELEQESEVLRSVKVASATGDRSGSKERIDELVIEIDRCLALLSN